jgi:dihydroflavonol-4-reductase
MVESHRIPVMKVLVTGGTGFLGSHLVDRLLRDRETEVYALVRNPGKARWIPDSPNLHILVGNLFDVPRLPPGLSTVFHLAGLTKTFKPSAYYTVNQAGTASLFRALGALAEAPRVIHASSLAAGGPSVDGRPRREADPPSPVSPYGLSKLEAEREASKHGGRFPLVILRLGAVYGPRDEDFLAYFRWVQRGLLPLFGRTPRPLSLCYVQDAVTALLVAAEAARAPGETFNVASPVPATWREIGETAARLLGRKAIPVRIPLWAIFAVCACAEGISRLSRRATPLNFSKYQDARPESWVADVDKARQLLGFEARTPLSEGLSETLDWYVRNAWL